MDFRNSNTTDMVAKLGPGVRGGRYDRERYQASSRNILNIYEQAVTSMLVKYYSELVNLLE